MKEHILNQEINDLEAKIARFERLYNQYKSEYQLETLRTLNRQLDALRAIKPERTIWASSIVKQPEPFTPTTSDPALQSLEEFLIRNRK